MNNQENTLYTLTKLSKQFKSHYTYTDQVLSFSLIDSLLYVTCSDGISAIRLRLDNRSLRKHIAETMELTSTSQVDCSLRSTYYVNNRKHVNNKVDWDRSLEVITNNRFPDIAKIMTSEVKDPVSNIDIDFKLLNRLSKLVDAIYCGASRQYVKLELQGEYKPLIGRFINDSNCFIVVMPLKL